MEFHLVKRKTICTSRASRFPALMSPSQLAESKTYGIRASHFRFALPWAKSEAMTGGEISDGLGHRLVRAREKLGFARQKDFAAATGTPIGSLKDYESGKTIPGGEALAKFAMIGVSLEFLLFGRGEVTTHAEQPRAGYVYLPLYEARASAGGGAVIEGERVVDLLAFREDWLRNELNAAPRDVALLFVQGRSMEPDLRAGDVIMIDVRDRLAQYEGIYVVRMDGALLVKELQRLPGGTVRFKSKNHDYEAFDRDAKDLQTDGFAVLGRVVWGCRRF